MKEQVEQMIRDAEAEIQAMATTMEAVVKRVKAAKTFLASLNGVAKEKKTHRARSEREQLLRDALKGSDGMTTCQIAKIIGMKDQNVTNWLKVADFVEAIKKNSPKTGRPANYYKLKETT